MRMIKWFLPFLLCATFFIGCAKQPENEPVSEQSTDILVIGETPPQEGTAAPIQTDGGGTAAPTPQLQLHAGFTVVHTVAYVLDDILYGGVVYTNTESVPMTLMEAVFTFETETGSVTETAAPFAGGYDVVNPGETGCFTVFLPVEEGTATVSSLTVVVSGQAAQREVNRLSVSDARLIKNYPFPTLSGSLKNESTETTNLNMVYVQFFDEADALLGVWYFPYNAMLTAGQSTPFVVHMRSFNPPGLMENTVRMEFYAYGM